MNTSVILSYAFVYFVLFLVVPFVLVTFTMTCIKFFKTSHVKNVGVNIKLNPDRIANKPVGIFNKLNTIVKGKYNILYGTTMDSIVDIGNTDKPEDAHQHLQHCHLDYVVVDEQSSVKLVITDPQHNTPENNEFIDQSLAEVGIKVIHLASNQQCDETLIRNSLAA
ncbi:DUF2726 domain-containing protein [Shewanella sp. 10N.286.48.B5]|uniref:DUF2726 domain-containing protein n=1 Tax=Shewanella sp. 10N.286.48.B5 TaxID=1880834 RepID=UPI000C82CE47|nr:DUF2726 domain-containing protein [Shewanella sp. 10N.286.48.B5]PMH89461.1 DUF2726 domain-containing protein [Shewanella sp. 10N.286.48.B5]